METVRHCASLFACIFMKFFMHAFFMFHFNYLFTGKIINVNHSYDDDYMNDVYLHKSSCLPVTSKARVEDEEKVDKKNHTEEK
jgi:hypothetical protein